MKSYVDVTFSDIIARILSIFFHIRFSSYNIWRVLFFFLKEAKNEFYKWNGLLRDWDLMHLSLWLVVLFIFHSRMRLKLIYRTNRRFPSHDVQSELLMTERNMLQRRESRIQHSNSRIQHSFSFIWTFKMKGSLTLGKSI